MPETYVKRCGLGKGTFAGVEIKEGERILRFSGPLIDFDQSMAVEDLANPLQIGPSLYVDTQESLASVNHSCAPNSGFRDPVTLFAVKNIEKDEEITFDYSTSMEDASGWTMECHCQSKECRGVIGNFSGLPREVQENLIKSGIVPRWIQVIQKVASRASRHGRGVFAKVEIKGGEEVMKFTGPRLDFGQTIAKGEQSCNPLQIGQNLYVDTEIPAVFSNHSCDPNCGLKDPVTLFALKNIQKDEEIRWDYSTSMDEDFWTMPCSCGSSACRGLIRDFKYVPKETQEKYIELGIVPDWLLKRSHR